MSAMRNPGGEVRATMRSERSPELAPVKVVAATLRRLRKAAGLSQAALAKAAGLHRVTVVRIERGQHELETSTARALADVLGCTPADLLAPPAAAPAPVWLRTFRRSSWANALHVSDDEFRWLLSIQGTFWEGTPPTNNDLAQLIQWRRNRDT